MSWSYSKLISFETCAFQYKLRYVDRLPESKSPAADRGTAIHLQAEHFVLGKLNKVPSTLMKFSDDFIALRARCKEGLVQGEEEWGFNRDWLPTTYKGAWLRMKADAVAYNKARTHAIVIDYKSGRKYGNEVKHAEQTMLYALATAIREPLVKNFTTELWYIDKDEITSIEYTREKAMSFLPLFDKRATKIDNEKVFPANPNIFSCQWCSFGPNKGNQCKHGVSAGNLMSIAEYRKKFV